jgi:hypothetical protein
MQSARAKACASVYIDTPLTRPTSNMPGASNTASFYADTSLTTAAADTEGYEVPHNNAAAVNYSAPGDGAQAPEGGYEVPLDDTAGVDYSVPTNTRGSAQVHCPLSTYPPPSAIRHSRRKLEARPRPRQAPSTAG